MFTKKKKKKSKIHIMSLYVSYDLQFFINLELLNNNVI